MPRTPTTEELREVEEPTWFPGLEMLEGDPGPDPEDPGIADSDIPEPSPRPAPALAPSPAPRPRRQQPPAPAEEPRALAYDTAAENALLCAVIGDRDGNRWADECLQIVGPEHFYHEAHQVIWGAIRTLRQQGADVDMVTVAGKLQSIDRLSECGGFTYLEVLSREDAWPERAPKRAAAIRQKALLREIGSSVAPALRRLAFDDVMDPLQAIDGAIADLERARATWQPVRAATLRTGLEVKERAGQVSYLWDRWLVRNHMNSIIAPSGAGKTYLILDLIKPTITGCPWPDGTPYDGPVGPCIYLDYEAFEDVIVERAEAMGIPLQMILFQPLEELCYLNRPDAEAILAGWIHDVRPATIAVDSWRASIPGEPEDDSVTGRFARMLDRLGYMHGVTPLLSAHVRKVIRGGRWTLTQDDARGTSDLQANSRVMVGIEKPDKGCETLRLRVLKVNRGAAPDPLGFCIGDEGLQWTTPPRPGRQSKQYDRGVESVISIIEQRGPLCYSDLQKALASLEHPVSESTMLRIMNPPDERDRVIVKGGDNRWGLIAHRQ